MKLLVNLSHYTWLDVLHNNQITNHLQAFTDAVKGDKFHVGHATWQCLDLLEVLCQLAERGHAGSVRPMLEYPRKHCPEVLLLGVASITVLLFH